MHYMLLYRHEHQPKTVFIDEVKVGGVYEIVVTQMFGIYRFRVGDVIRVTRFHEETPVVEFIYRYVVAMTSSISSNNPN